MQIEFAPALPVAGVPVRASALEQPSESLERAALDRPRTISGSQLLITFGTALAVASLLT